MASTQNSPTRCPKANVAVKCSDQVKDPDLDNESLSGLQIPTLSVSGSPASWLSRSKLVTNKMAFQNDGDSSCDEAASSLGDSAYDFLDDRSATTDDEERDVMTESTSSESLEPHRPSSLSAAWAHTSQDSDLNDSPVSLTTPTAHGIGLGNAYASLNTKEEGCLAEDPEEPIQFEEPSVVNINSSRLTEVCHTLRTIRNPLEAQGELQKAIKVLPEGKCHITVRQTMASQSIDLKGKPYKVLILGEDPATELVIKKIASALATSTTDSKPGYDEASPSKFSIVPVSAFGDVGNPDVVLIDSGLELTVEYCIAAAFLPTKEGKDILHLRMANGVCAQSCWVRSTGGYSLSDTWTLPDLAIFLMPAEENDPLANRTRGVAHSFMHRHGVPSIVIQKKATWTKPAILDYLTPHLCLETQQAHGRSDSAKTRFPIDLQTFLNIDAGQLNRNLACLARFRPHSQSPRQTTTESNDLQASLKSVPNAFCQTVQRVYKEYTPRLLRYLKLNPPLVLFFILLASFFSCWVGSGYLGVIPMGNSSLLVKNSSITKEGAQFFQSSAIQPVVSSIASTSSQKSITKTLSSNTEIASFLMDTYALGPDRSDDFVVQILGDHHVVVNVPRWMHQTKKAPALTFEVSRQNKSIEHISSKIGEGVYALQIPSEEAYGVLNVSVTMKSKITKQRNLEVDFGSSWLQKVELRRLSRLISDVVTQDLSIFQTGLSTVYNHSCTGLSSFVHQTKHTFATRKRLKQVMLASHLKWRSQKRAILLAQSKELSRYVSRIRTGQKQISQQIHRLQKEFVQSLSTFTGNHTHTASNRANIYRQRWQEAKAVRQAVAAEYLKYAQKKALRAWWKVVGVPKRPHVNKFPTREGETFPNIPEEDKKLHHCF